MPCPARVADGAIRGAIVGSLWAFFGPTGDARRPIGFDVLRRGGASAAVHGFGSVLFFSGFLGIYSGVSCTSQTWFAQDSLMHAGFSGAIMGGFIGASMAPTSPRNVLACATATSLISVLFTSLLQRRGNNR